MRRIIHGAAAWCALAACALAQSPDPQLSTNRPNQTESPDPVPAGYAHFELGWQLSEDEEGLVEFRKIDAPASVVRFGLNSRLELSFSWAGVAWQELEAPGVSQETHGARDGGVAAKFRLWGEDGLRPRASLRAGVSLPFGEDGFSSERADPFILFLATHSLGERVALNYNLGPSWSTRRQGADLDTLSSLIYIVSADFALNEDWAASLEVFGQAALSDSGRADNSVDFSLAYRFGNVLIADFIAGRGLADSSADWFIGSGVTFQAPLR